MNENVAKLMSMTVGQRFDELNAMSAFNDPKAILLLVQEWDFQAKVSAILALKIRSDAHARRGSIGFAKECLMQIASLSDGVYESTDRSGHGLRISTREEHPELNPRTIEVPNWYFDCLEAEIDSINEIYRQKATHRRTYLASLEIPVKLEGDKILQGQSAVWEGANLFNYFPINLNKVRSENKVVDGTREQIVRSAIASVVTQAPIKKIKLSDQDRVVTLGSCFASELHASMTKHGIKAETLRIEESINTTHANLALLESIRDRKLSPSLENLFKSTAINERLARLHGLLLTAKMVVITVGVSPIVVDRQTGSPLYLQDLKSKFESNEADMRFTTVAENSANIVNIIKILRAISPEISPFITLSPVPLIGVPTGRSVLERDVISKSTIRLAIEDARSHVDFTYWPSFEAVRWLAPHIDPKLGFQAFGDPDNNSRQVSRWLVDEITKSFIEHVIDRD